MIIRVRSAASGVTHRIDLPSSAPITDLALEIVRLFDVEDIPLLPNGEPSHLGILLATDPRMTDGMRVGNLVGRSIEQLNIKYRMTTLIYHLGTETCYSSSFLALRQTRWWDKGMAKTTSWNPS